MICFASVLWLKSLVLTISSATFLGWLRDLEVGKDGHGSLASLGHEALWLLLSELCQCSRQHFQLLINYLLK